MIEPQIPIRPETPQSPKPEYSDLQNPDNRVDFYLKTERFLAKYCGGRVGPEEPELTKGNSAQVLDPASIVV
jgi:hypothetical protein